MKSSLSAHPVHVVILTPQCPAQHVIQSRHGGTWESFHTAADKSLIKRCRQCFILKGQKRFEMKAHRKRSSG